MRRLSTRRRCGIYACVAGVTGYFAVTTVADHPAASGPAVVSTATRPDDISGPDDPTPGNGVQLVAHRIEEAASPEELLDRAVRILERGSSSGSARRAAAAALPLNQMNAANRRRAEQVLQSVSLFRELPAVEFDVDPRAYRFFVSHPDAAAAIWRVMSISKLQMWQTGPDEYEADAGDGSLGVIDVLVRGAEQNVILCEGTFTSPFLAKPLSAKALFHLRTRFVHDPQGAGRVQSRLSMFVALDSQTVETAARLVSPLSNMIVDRNFREVCLFVHMMSLAMQRQPEWVEVMAARLDGVLESSKRQLVDVTTEVYVAAKERELKAAAQEPPRALPYGNPAPLRSAARNQAPR